MGTTTLTAMTGEQTERKVWVVLNIQFHHELEMETWGPFCKRHSLWGGMNKWGDDIWTTMRGHLPYSQVEPLLRHINLDPSVKKAWIRDQGDEAEERVSTT